MAVRQVKKVSCEDCFFRKNMLCALNLDEACPTFRPDHPEGLRPPQQLRFVFRQERRRQAAWAFPDAQEQAALHAISFSSAVTASRSDNTARDARSVTPSIALPSFTASSA